ncbi:HM13-like protein [Mya arenaria]|uniref:HM13-like protein n=1 Tax=Mya arenaria TaxID=6604 RepID=A0ABY7FPS6_MYAAR|nr:HM13-like protein [Mya arenaria]
MAESVTEVPVLNETFNGTAENATAKIPSTPEGMFVAYSSLVIMALIPIFLGSFRSVRYHKEQKDSGEKPETMSSKDAAMFPIIASCTLFGIYIVFQIFSKEYINMLLAVYFFFLGVLALAHILSPILHPLIPPLFPNQEYHLIFTEGPAEKKEELVNWKFDRKDLLVLVLCGAVGLWYLIKKHWVANNLFGLAFAVNGIEFLSLNSITTGCILLGGLFIYDVFWVFGTNVMVTVAKSFEAPIKLVFPQDLLENGLAANNFAMLGLGDIKGSRVYFYASFLAYFLGLLLTILVMHFFKHAQPALLYLVPACIGVPVLVALVRGEIKPLFKYEDNPEEKEKEADKKVDGKKETVTEKKAKKEK